MAALRPVALVACVLAPALVQCTHDGEPRSVPMPSSSALGAAVDERVALAPVPQRAAEEVSGVPHEQAPSVGAAPPRTAAVGSTQGRIACGTVWCEAGKAMCGWLEPSQTWACVDAGSSTPTSNSYECDDVTDCGGGLACCRTWATANESFRCVRRHPEADGGECREEVCNDAAPTCPPGLSCQSGVCRPVAMARQAATCEGVRCPPSEPVCHWEGGTSRCVDRAAAGALLSGLLAGESDDRAVLGCTRPADCAGWACCTGGAMGARYTGCEARCDLSNTAKVCDSDVDCRAIAPGACGNDRACIASFRCRAAGQAVRGLKVCASE